MNNDKNIGHEEMEGTTANVPPPAAVDSFNPWRVMLPAAALLLVVIGGVYYFGDNSSDTVDGDQPAFLQPDPNSKPVVPAAPVASGASERNLPVTSAFPTTTPVGSQTTSTTTRSRNANSGSSTLDPNLFPPLPSDPNANPEIISSGDTDDAANGVATNPTPKFSPAANRNTNQRRASPDTSAPDKANAPDAPPTTASSPIAPPVPTPARKQRESSGTDAPASPPTSKPPLE